MTISNVFAGKNATDDLRLSALDLKPNFKLMMVGSLEADIQDVQNSIDNRDVVDDFDDNDERTSYNFHKMQVRIANIRFESRTKTASAKWIYVIRMSSVQQCNGLQLPPICPLMPRFAYFTDSKPNGCCSLQ